MKYVYVRHSKNLHHNFRKKFGDSGHSAAVLLMCTDSTLKSAHETAECKLLLLCLCTVPSYPVSVHLGGHGRNESRQSSNTMKAYANGSISCQYFFDTNYFHWASEVLKKWSRKS